VAVLKSAAECTPPELYARGLHALDQAEQAMEPGAVTSFAQLAQAYFQAVTTAVAMTMEAAGVQP
jgi:hypothetical protein